MVLLKFSLMISKNYGFDWIAGVENGSQEARGTVSMRKFQLTKRVIGEAAPTSPQCAWWTTCWAG